MATDPIPVQRRYDAQKLSEALRELILAINTGSNSLNKAANNSVAPRTQAYPLRKAAMAFMLLPDPADAGVGAHAIVTDSQTQYSADMIGTEYTIDAYGVNGPYTVPVYSSGQQWRVG